MSEAEWSLTEFVRAGEGGALAYDVRFAHVSFSLMAGHRTKFSSVVVKDPLRIWYLLPCCGSRAVNMDTRVICRGCGANLRDEGYPPDFPTAIIATEEKDILLRSALTMWLEISDLNPLELEIELSRVYDYVINEANAYNAWPTWPTSVNNTGTGSIMNKFRHRGGASSAVPSTPGPRAV